MHVVLTTPPSVNAMYATVNGRRVKTRVARQWAAASAAKARLCMEPFHSGHYAVAIFAAVNHRSDLDNLAKPIMDTLVLAGAPDDRWCDRIYMERVKPNRALPAGCVSVFAWSLPQGPVELREPPDMAEAMTRAVS